MTAQGGVVMWMGSYVEDILVRERIAEAQRDGERRQLLRRARPATGKRRPWAGVKHVVDMLSMRWPKGRKERMAVR
jgi:hypothetical protein